MLESNEHSEPMTEPIGPNCWIKLRGKIWHVLFTKRGSNDKSKSLRTSSKALATSKAVEMLRQWEIGRYDPWQVGDASSSVDKAIKVYLKEKPGNKSRLENANLVRRLCSDNGISLVAAITPERITSFVYQPHLAQASKWSYYKKISACINWLAKKGYFVDNPIDEVTGPREYEAIPKHFTEEEFEQFLHSAMVLHEHNWKLTFNPPSYPLWYMPIFELMAYSGMRPSEAMRLSWDDIVWPEDTQEGIGKILVTGKTKTDVERVITMHPRAERVLRFMEKEHRLSSDYDEPVLKGPDGEGRFKVKGLSNRFWKIRKFAKTKPIKLYDLRHTYAAYLRRKGLELYLISEEFGHKSFKTTQKYGKLGTNERMRATFNKITE